MNILRCVLAILAMQLCHSSISFGQAEPTNAEAVKSLRKAAEQGDAAAQSCLGRCYQEGIGVPKDYSEAARWYRKAAEQGDDHAQSCLGLFYATGEGVPRDIVESYKWLNIVAASRGRVGERKILQIIEAKMTPAQIAEAQRLSSEWKPVK